MIESTEPPVLFPMAVTRRRLLQGAALAGVTAAPTLTQANPIYPARAFTDSVGVNVHLTLPPYDGGFPRFMELLAASGINYLREELRPGLRPERWRKLQSSLRVRWNLVVSPTTNTVSQMLALIDDLGPTHFAAIEGQNEGDTPWFQAHKAAKGDWSGTVVSYQRDIFRSVSRHYPAGSLPVLSPTLLDWKPSDVSLIRDSAAFCDIVALHSYVQHAQEPETADDHSALSWYLRNYRDTYKPGAPVMVTETGYCNVVAAGGRGVSERAAGIYLPRLLLYNFSVGVLRTFLYEFMDGGIDPSNNEHHYGIVRFDGTPKPAYYAIRALLVALADQGALGRAAPAVQLSFAGAPADLRHVVFSMDNGTLVIALWRPIRVWDVGRGEDIVADPVEMTVIVTPQPKRAEWSVPGDSVGWNSAAVRDGRIRTLIDGRVTLVRLGDHEA